MKNKQGLISTDEVNTRAFSSLAVSFVFYDYDFFFVLADAYSTRDIIYEWVPEATEVVVGNTEMAQFEYKGSKLTTHVDVFSVGRWS